MNFTSEQLREYADAVDAHNIGKSVQRFERNQWILECACPAAWGYKYPRRPKPEPKTRPWSKPEDVPGPVCWIRMKDDSYCWLICCVSNPFIRIHEQDWGYDQISGWEYSTDRKTWHKCEVTE